MRFVGTSQAVPTVAVEHPDIPGAVMRVNVADFDPTKHKRWEGALPAAAAQGSQTPAPAPSGSSSGVSSEKTAAVEPAASGAAAKAPPTAAELRAQTKELVRKSLEGQGYPELKAQAKAEGLSFDGQPTKEAVIEALADKLAGAV
jgi:hypothetical protein